MEQTGTPCLFASASGAGRVQACLFMAIYLGQRVQCTLTFLTVMTLLSSRYQLMVPVLRLYSMLSWCTSVGTRLATRLAYVEGVACYCVLMRSDVCGLQLQPRATSWMGCEWHAVAYIHLAMHVVHLSRKITPDKITPATNFHHF